MWLFVFCLCHYCHDGLWLDELGTASITHQLCCRSGGPPGEHAPPAGDRHRKFAPCSTSLFLSILRLLLHLHTVFSSSYSQLFSMTPMLSGHLLVCKIVSRPARQSERIVDEKTCPIATSNLLFILFASFVLDLTTASAGRWSRANSPFQPK